MNTPSEVAQRRGRIQFLALAALFFGPVGVAFWMYYGGHLIPGHRVNHGELIRPTVTLPAVPTLLTADGSPVGETFLRRQWTLLYFTGDRCDDTCRHDLADLKKVRLAMDHERDRVHRVLLGNTPCCTAAEIGPADPDLTAAYVDSDAGRRLLAAFPPTGQDLVGSGVIYVVDPLGNLVMRFPPDAERKGLIKDLDKLLRLSHIG
jgi:cytochrome oxidase Cu insertion factor (SCO1/SenC/PrrC family)